MAKSKTTFYCQNCGAQHGKWMGQCNKCGEWNTIVEEVVSKEAAPEWKSGNPSTRIGKVQARSIKSQTAEAISRKGTGSEELDRVLGGGLVDGSVTLLGGEPCIGKSTLMLQVALQISAKCLYVSGEESEQQV